jgi:hypothetical protein
MGPYFRRIKGLSQTVFTRKIADPMRPLAPTPYCQQVMNCKMTIEMEEDRFSTINVLNELNVFVVKINKKICLLALIERMQFS